MLPVTTNESVAPGLVLLIAKYVPTKALPDIPTFAVTSTLPVVLTPTADVSNFFILLW